MHTYKHTYKHTCTHICTHPSTHTSTYKHTCKHTYTHIRTHTCGHMQKWYGTAGLSRPWMGGTASMFITWMPIKTYNWFKTGLQQPITGLPKNPKLTPLILFDWLVFVWLSMHVAFAAPVCSMTKQRLLNRWPLGQNAELVMQRVRVQAAPELVTLCESPCVSSSLAVAHCHWLTFGHYIAELDKCVVRIVNVAHNLGLTVLSFGVDFSLW